jgi:hypothetical protein
MNPSTEAAALWGTAKNQMFTAENRLQCALQALEFFGGAYEAREEEEEDAPVSPEFLKRKAPHLEAFIHDYLMEHFEKFAETWWPEHLAKEQFTAEQASVGWHWQAQHPGTDPVIDDAIEIPLGYIKGEKKTYVRVYDMVRDRDIWLRKYE